MPPETASVFEKPNRRFTPKNAVHFGRRGGSRSTLAKQRAARRNGRRGGRPRTQSKRPYTDVWITPDDFYQRLNAEFGPFTLDVAADATNTKCERFYTEGDDGLRQPWGPARVWCNPPYSAAGKWIAKAAEEAQAGALVVCLVPAQGGWWRLALETAHEVRFLAGRLKFTHGTTGRLSSPRFPCAVLVFLPGGRQGDVRVSTIPCEAA